MKSKGPEMESLVQWRGSEYLSFGEALPSVRALRQQRVKKLHPLSQRGQQHGRSHRQSLDHRLTGQTHTDTPPQSTEHNLNWLLRSYVVCSLLIKKEKNKKCDGGKIKKHHKKYSTAITKILFLKWEEHLHQCQAAACKCVAQRSHRSMWPGFIWVILFWFLWKEVELLNL